MKGLETALERLANSFEGFTEELRDIAAGLSQGGGVAGAGEEPVDGFAKQAAPRGDGIDDDTNVTLRSGDLRKVIDAYRKLVRFAREGKIPTQDQRFELHQHVKKVKHLIRRPHR